MRKPDENLIAPPTGGSPVAQTSSLAPAPASSPQENSSLQASRHHLLRHEIRVWTRDLLIAIGLALVIIVFLYQPVKVEGTSMAPLLSDQVHQRHGLEMARLRHRAWRDAEIGRAHV